MLSPLIFVVVMAIIANAYQFGFGARFARQKVLTDLLVVEFSLYPEDQTEFQISRDVRANFVSAYSDVLRAYTKQGIFHWMGKTLSVYELYPDDDDRTKEKLLGGLTNVTRVEFLQSLPCTDLRKKELETILYPDPERRAVLEKNLEAMDKYLIAAAGVRTRDVFETVARLGLDENEIFGDEKMGFDELGSIVHYVEENRDELEEGAYWSELRLFELMLKFLHRRLSVPMWEGIDPWGTSARGYI